MMKSFILAFTSLIAILNPLGSIPMFMAMTGAYTRERRKETIKRAIITATLVMIIFALLGTSILRFFGITTEAFRIAGGVIFFGIGWDMLQARRSRVKTTEEEEIAGSSQEDVSIVPLGIPGLAGPGTITTVIALNGRASTFAESAAVYLAILLSALVLWATLSAAPFVSRRLGTTGMNVMTRLMGLLVTVIGAQFVIDGVSTVVFNISSRIN
jgi:multiple antibiotic resistance protein